MILNYIVLHGCITWPITLAHNNGKKLKFTSTWLS
jgi:hypothetical protein